MNRMVQGVLIAESLRVGTTLDGLRLTVTSLARLRQPSPAHGQPPVWTIMSFDTDVDPDRLATALSAVLDDSPSWYADFHDDQRKFVVYPHGKVFSFERGSAEGRQAAVAYGRELGIPDDQLDWGD